MQPCKIGFNLWLETEDGVTLSVWRIALLQAVADTGSISGAAERVGVHFRVAWKKIREMEERLQTPLVVGHAGGTGGGGATLTPEAKDLVHRFRTLATEVEAEVRLRVEAVFPGVREETNECSAEPSLSSNSSL